MLCKSPVPYWSSSVSFSGFNNLTYNKIRASICWEDCYKACDMVLYLLEAVNPGAADACIASLL